MSQASSTSGIPLEDNPIVAIIGLGAAGVSLWAILCAARLSVTSIGMLLAALNGGAARLLENVILSAVGGLFAGVAVAVVRSVYRKPNRLTESFITALFNKGLTCGPFGVYLGRVFVGGIVGFIVGAITGSSGTISLPQLISGTQLFIIRNVAYPTVAFANGGFGGPGGTDFFPLIFLVLVVIVFAVIIGICSGFFLSLIVGGVVGATKGGTKAYVIRVLEAPSEACRPEKKSYPIRSGVINGLLVGVIVGVLEGVVTAGIFAGADVGAPCTGEPQICALQLALKDRGYYAGVVNGVFGPRTKKALRVFQKSMGLRPSSRLDPTTAEKLGIQPIKQ